MGGTTPPITVPDPVVVADGPSFMDAIDGGSKLASNTVTVYFAGAGEVFDRKTSIGWTGYEVQQAMLAFQQFANVGDLHFSITRDATNATLKLVNVQKAGFLGYFNPPGTGDEGVGVFNHTGKGWDFNDESGGLQQGGYGFVTMLHEFGHALGMAHPHDAGGKSTVWQGVSRATGDLGKFDFNQGIYSTMTYNDGWQTDPDGQNTSDDFGWQGTKMGFDVVVLQQKYGANTTFASGDTLYTLAWPIRAAPTSPASGTLAAPMRSPTKATATPRSTCAPPILAMPRGLAAIFPMPRAYMAALTSRTAP